MALKQTQLSTSPTFVTPKLRIYPYEDGIRPGTLAALTGAPVLPHATPLTKSGDNWILWVDAAVIDGFLWSELTHESDAADETTIQVFRAGRVHHDDVPVPSGQSQGALTTALKAQALRTKNIEVSGVVGVG